MHTNDHEDWQYDYNFNPNRDQEHDPYSGKRRQISTSSSTRPSSSARRDIPPGILEPQGVSQIALFLHLVVASPLHLNLASPLRRIISQRGREPSQPASKKHRKGKEPEPVDKTDIKDEDDLEPPSQPASRPEPRSGQ
ncbi:hypothetical protein M407DRAFT_28235 [Tulasnella calospora MUT 4182]|uniref:Uncharacterized protein n=1 Tax=Tulasnella calospora MUT 4182 TaxID=1051891 RepID=A0A0C3Q1S1_9AGAM|nr:hypothetical protein M407DRAFT_28235 [Tulasnella calospora MUT 4182]